MPRNRALCAAVALLASAAAAGGEEGYYYRVPQSQGTSTDTPAPSASLASTVPGTGSFGVYGPPYVRTDAGKPVRVQMRSSESGVGLRWISVGQPLPDGTSLTDYGLVTGTARVAGTYPGIIAEASDARGRTARTQPFTLAVGTPQVTLDPASTAYRLRVGQPFVLQAGASNMAGASTWSLPISSGSMPGGLAFDARNARLIGEVLGTGAATFAFSVQDGADGSVTRSADIGIDAAGALGLTGVSGAYGAHLGNSLSTGTPVPVGFRGTPAYALDIAVPTGMSFANGILSGRPSSAVSVRTGTVTATDPWDGRSVSSSFTLEVAGPLAFATQPKDLAGILGTFASMSPGVTGVVKGMSFALLKGGAPTPGALAACTGMGFDASSGRISGTPSAACSVAGLSLRVTDGTGASLDSGTFAVSARPDVTAGSASYIATSTFVVPNFNSITLRVAGTRAPDVENTYWGARQCNVGTTLYGAGGGSGTSNALAKGAAAAPVPGSTVTVKQSSDRSWRIDYTGADGSAYYMDSGLAWPGYPFDGDSKKCTLIGAFSTSGRPTGNVPGTYNPGDSSTGGVSFAWN